MNEIITVDKMIAILKSVSLKGYGEYKITCNREYFLVLEDGEPDINQTDGEVDFGGYA